MELRIRVGAAVDRSMSEAFRPLLKAAEQAKAALERTSKRSGATVANEAQRAANAEAKAYAKAGREMERWEREKARLAERSARARQKAAEAAASADVRAAERAAKEKARIESRERSTTERAARASARAQLAAVEEVERAARSGGAGRGPGVAKAKGGSRFFDPHYNASAAVSAGGAALRKGAQIAGDIARGAGVRTDLGSFIGGEVELEKRATDLSNAAFMPGKDGPNGSRVDPNALIAQARSVGSAAAFDPTKVMEGLQKFVAKTGDLQAGRDVLKEMAIYSRASGTELEDMVDAAGDVSNALGDTDNKGEKIKGVMRAIAAQGKEGAVEIKDLATQMAKLSAASSQFSGDPSAVMAQMGAMVQMTRAKGGASSATNAATSLGSFTNTFSKGARLKAFDAFGVDIMGGDGKLSLKKIILGSLRAAEEHGGQTDRKVFSKNMGQMFMDSAARKSMKGWETTFIDAGGGEAGLKAVEQRFDELASATMNEKEIAESFSKSMGTTEAKVTLFNNEMSKTANELKTVLLPAFQALGPAILSASKAAVDWFATLTGTKQAQQDTANANALIRGVNATTGLRDVAGRTAVSDDEAQAAQAEAAAAKKDLQDAIAAKELQVKNERRNNNMDARWLSASEDDVRAKAQQGDASAQRYVDRKGELDTLKDQLSKLNTRSDDLAEKISTKTLRVMIVGDSRAPDLSGELTGGTRTPPPGGKPR